MANPVAKGSARDSRELFEFTIEPFVSGGFQVIDSIHRRLPPNITGAGVWPSIDKAKEIAEATAKRLLHGAAVTWGASSGIS